MDTPTYLGVAGVAIGIFAGVAPAIWPDQKWVAVGIAVLAIAVLVAASIAFAASNFPDRFPELKRAWFLIPLGAVLAILIINLLRAIFPKSVEVAQAVSTSLQPTYLRLQFNGKDEQPQVIAQSNIADWYTLWNPHIEIKPQYPASVPMDKREGPAIIYSPPHWAIYVLFDKPVTYRQLTISFSSPGFGPYEVRRNTDRMALILVTGQIPSGALEAYATP